MTPRSVLVLALFATAASLAAAQAAHTHTHAPAPANSPTPYAGQERRDIKALDPEEIAGLQQGRGMGFAKPAELNGYPGPMHVLEMAEALRLSDAQRQATRLLMDTHKARARELGQAVIDAEAELDRLFARREATPERVEAATQRVATAQARLRAEHLNTHLKQAALLDPAQVAQYGPLRGYGAAGTAAPASRGGGHTGHGGHSGHRH